MFKDVNFAYVPNRPVLKHNSFEALPGRENWPLWPHWSRQKHIDQPDYPLL